MKPNEFTRRNLLSCAQKIFDTIGFTVPVAIVPKLQQKTEDLGLKGRLGQQVTRRNASRLQKVG